MHKIQKLQTDLWSTQPSHNSRKLLTTKLLTHSVFAGQLQQMNNAVDMDIDFMS